MITRKARTVGVRPVDDQHQVVSVQGGAGRYRRRPCGGCPWRIDQTGSFPAEAFAQSAHTAHDAAVSTFGCHESDPQRPATCAGFLLRGAEHNLAVRMRTSDGRIDMTQVHDGGHPLHPGYRSMAVANGLDPDDPRLAACRPSTYETGGPDA